MINNNSLIYFTLPAIVFQITAATLAILKKKGITALMIISVIILATFIATIWISTGVPPMKTSGETRLWYATFMPLVGLILFLRYRLRWIPIFTAIMSSIFIVINILNPEAQHEELPALLNSPWFIPHVVLYMFSYAFFGLSFLLSLTKIKDDTQKAIDEAVQLGLGLFTIATCIGALWAKTAWGHFWTWDLKETWACITALSYYSYIATRKERNSSVIIQRIILVLAFAALQMCWWGHQYLPHASQSLHAY